MKRYLLILMGMFVLSVLGISAAVASIALPPAASPIAEVQFSKCMAPMGKQIGEPPLPEPLGSLANCLAECNSNFLNKHPDNPTRVAEWNDCRESCYNRYNPDRLCGKELIDQWHSRRR